MRSEYKQGRIRRLQPFLLAIGISALAGMAYPFVFGVLSLKLMLGGAALGCSVTICLSIFETLVYDRTLRKLSVKKAIAIKSLIYALIISGCYLVVSIFLKNEEDSALKVMTYQSVFTFSLIASLIISSFVTISRILGQNELVLLVIGRYHKPREEERILMFVDLAGSTAIAEKIGSIEFMRLLNDFFFDLTGPILHCGGEIHKYVGDEVIITWRLKAGQRAGHCVDCFFRMQDQVRENSAHYLSAYGMVPEFRGGLHCGTVVIGEMGDFKKEIAILGDTVNTAARIVSEAAHRGKKLLVSEPLRAAVEPFSKERFVFGALGEIQLKGREKVIGLFEVERSQPAPSKRILWLKRLFRKKEQESGRVEPGSTA